MADKWNTAGGGGKFWKHSEEGKGAVIQGIYRAKKEHQGDFDGALYVIKTKEGIVNVNSSKVLARKFEEIDLGSEVRIEYLGTLDSEKRKGVQYYDFDVKYRTIPMKTAGDEENTVSEVLDEMDGTFDN